MTDRLLAFLLGLLVVGSLWSPAGPAALVATAVLPLVLVLRSTDGRQLPRRWIVALGIPLVGSLVWLLLDRPGPGEVPGSLRRVAVLFLGFYFLPLLVSSVAFARSEAGPRVDKSSGESPRPSEECPE